MSDLDQFLLSVLAGTIGGTLTTILYFWILDKIRGKKDEQ